MLSEIFFSPHNEWVYFFNISVSLIIIKCNHDVSVKTVGGLSG